MKWRTISLTSAMWVGGSLPAHAYMDPGTGSIIAQGIIGAIIAAGVFARSWWARLLTFLGLNRAAKATPAEDADRK